MAITVTERPDSRTYETGERKSQDRRYNVLGTDDQTAAKAALAAAAPATIDGLARLGVHVEPRYVDEDDPDRSLWLGIADYGILSGQAVEPLEVGDVIVSVTTIGGTEHVTGTLERIQAKGQGAMGAPAADGIGDNGQGEVEGVDIFVSALELEVTKVFETAATAPSPSVLDNFGVVTNDAEFTITDTKTGRARTFAVGTLLYLGHREGGAREDGALEITCRFLARKPKPAHEYGLGLISMDECQSWSYLWFRKEQKEDDTAKKLYASFIGGYEDRVYDKGDFSDLDLGPPA